MATLIIRNLDHEVKACLCARAALHGCSMEEEAHSILRAALSTKPKPGTGAALVADIRSLVKRFGDIDLEVPPRTPAPPPPIFGGREPDE